MTRRVTPLRDFYKNPKNTPPSLFHDKRAWRDVVNAINRFSLYLGAGAGFADLTPENYWGFRRWLEERYAKGQINATCSRLRKAWKLAAAKGLAQPPRGLSIHIREPLEWETVPVGERSLRRFYDEFYYPLRIRGKSPRTHHLYGCSIRTFGRFLGRHATLEDFTDSTMAAFKADGLDRGLSPFSVNKDLCQLMAMARFAVRKKKLDDWPEVDPAREPVRIPKAWTKSDLETLWQAIRETPGEIDGINAADWWLALHHVLWWTAERISAVMALRWSDVDLETGWIVVRAETRKGGREDKTAQLPPVAIAALARIAKPTRDLVFPWPMSPAYIWHRYKKLLERAGLPTDRKSKFHRMRKAAASHFEAARGNATELLGHSHRSTTLSYLDPRIVKPVQAADLLFAPGVTT